MTVLSTTSSAIKRDEENLPLFRNIRRFRSSACDGFLVRNHTGVKTPYCTAQSRSANTFGLLKLCPRLTKK